MLTNNTKQDIRKLGLSQLMDWLEASGEKPFRARQIMKWIWNKSVTDFESMTDLSISLREKLNSAFSFYPVSILTRQQSADRTIKVAFSLHDNNIIEGVLIPSDKRMTACISSQVGCSLSCKFCATGYLERQRNLDPAEIYDQVVHINAICRETFGESLSNIVFMGMGEPLLNYRNVLDAIERLTGEQGLGISSKRITLSTAGIAKMIRKLADDQVKFNLALSLHAANDTKRNQIMPINESNTLDALKDALNYFYDKTRSQITFEYIVFRDFNDTLADAADLLQFVRKVPSKVNIIEYNPIDNADFQNTSEDKLEKFRIFLEKNRVNVRLRRSRGKDIDAACGQLANKHA